MLYHRETHVKRDREAHRQIWIKYPKETNLDEVQALFDPLSVQPQNIPPG